ncbi:uncharacterized protein LOC120659092 [Panicum virgatum]|uniref:uncharacterized protein LOC120659092 n=1 Tax=Panicum virgatum TaxID=38727 RepID=UPI0019D5A1A2|nr:uncharacterized protein LOC120659092 [Panicum virgatum]
MVRNGDTDLDEERVVEKFLRCMPKRYEQLVFSIETLLDLESLSIDDVAGRFKLDEPQAQVVLNTAVDDEAIDGWYLDSGATHHMTRRRDLSTDLDNNVCGSVWFGDASKVDNQGIGSIVFEGKNGEHWELHGVFYIPALRNSIMSLGWLDEGGSEVRIKDGILRIWDRRR